MPERYRGRLKPGMEVCDVAGDKVGTLAKSLNFHEDRCKLAPGSR